MTPRRESLLRTLAGRIIAIARDGVTRVAIDGVDGAGKTVLADELARALEPFGRPVIRASVDSFHNPRAHRYRLGPGSPEGFFRDSYNYEALRSALLDPLGPGGNGVYRRALFDHTTDSAVESPEERAEPGSILLFDGIFLHRPEVRECWDYSIWLDVPFEISIPRGAGRGMGSPDPHAESNRRYVEGQRLYIASCHPARIASVVVDNSDLSGPVLLER